MKTTVVWLRDELRLHDNALLAKAFKGNRENVLPVFCVDPRVYSASAVAKGVPDSNFQKCGALRANFVLESLEDLKRSLTQRGSNLVVSRATPAETFSILANEFDVDEIFCAEGACQEEIDDEKAVAELDVKLTKVWEGTMYHRDDVPSPDDVFTNWRSKVEKKQTPIRDEVSLPEKLPHAPASKIDESIPTLADLGYPARAEPDARGDFFAPVGGETAALARLRRYIWEEDRLSTYFDTRNGMIGQGYSTKFAPWLARGCLSPRRVAHECRKYERARVKNKSTYWVVFELTWRDFFEMTARKHGRKLFWQYGFKDLAPQQRWAGASSPSFKAWTLGRTGAPLVDANMRELVATGFMSNRGRQNVASYLVHDLGVDWRLGAAFFEAHLVDYTAPSNWGNWHAAAGLNGGRINRFNIVKQSRDYDEQGEYIKLWCPELKDVPAPQCFEPHKMSRADQVRYKCEIGVDYPRPVAAPKKNFENTQRPSSKDKKRNKGRGVRREYY